MRRTEEGAVRTRLFRHFPAAVTHSRLESSRRATAGYCAFFFRHSDLQFAIRLIGNLFGSPSRRGLSLEKEAANQLWRSFAAKYGVRLGATITCWVPLVRNTVTGISQLAEGLPQPSRVLEHCHGVAAPGPAGAFCMRDQKRRYPQV